MSQQVSGSEHEDIELRKTGYHAGFQRQGVPTQYQATDIVHQATSETPHHPSRPPNFLQPWRYERPSGQVVLERVYTATPERARDPSMGNKNASSATSDKGPAPLVNTLAASDNDELTRTMVDTKRGQAEVSRGSHESGESRVAQVSHPVMQAHSSDWLRHNVSHTQTQPSQVVPLVTPAALADMGHLYKLPTSATPSQPKIYPSGIFNNPLYTSASTTALQYSSYVTPSTVQMSTIPTYSPFISGFPLNYPVLAQGSVGHGTYTTVESYSAMLASMGSQVQQAQGAQVPISTYSGVIPLPYGSQLTHGITMLPKGSAQESVPTIGYLNQQLPAAPGILQSGHVFTGIVPLGSGLLTLPQRSEGEANRPDPSPGKEQEHNSSANLQNLKSEEDERNMQHEPEASPFHRRTYSAQPDDHLPHSRSITKVAPVVCTPSVDYQSVKDKQPYHETSSRHESVIMTVTIPSDKSRQVLAKQASPVYAAEEHHQWGGTSYHQPADNQGANPYHPTAPSSVQHSPHVRFHLSPSPQARPSPTITHATGSESQVVELAPRTSDPRTYSVPPPETVDPRPTQTQEVIVHSSALEPERPQMLSLMATPQISAPSFSNIPSYFTRGSVIQLASGELKRVEDMRTEDFVHSADMCGGLKIDSSTVVRINEHVDNGVALISFLVGEHKAQVSLEAPMEHPFFVFGQGWSAVKPDRSLKSYNLGCHKLAVGDVCVSLTVKDKHGRWPPQPQQLEEPLLQQQQLPPPPQEQSHKQLQQQIPVQSIFSGSSKETSPSWTSESKRPRLEPVQEDSDWRGSTDLRPDTTWQRESPQRQGHLEPPPSPYAFAIPPPVSSSYVSLEQPPSKFTHRTDNNANTVLVRTTDTLTGGKGDRPFPRSDGKPLQPLKRRWSDPMHMAQLAADQERYATAAKSSDLH